MHRPTDGQNPVRVVVLQSQTDEIVAHELEGKDKPDDQKAGLGLDLSVMAGRVEGAEQIEQEVANEESEYGAHNRRRVDCSKVAEGEPICGNDEDTDRGIVANGLR